MIYFIYASRENACIVLFRGMISILYKVFMCCKVCQMWLTSLLRKKFKEKQVLRNGFGEKERPILRWKVLSWKSR